MFDTSSRTGWSSPNTTSAARYRRPRGARAESCSKTGHDGRARAAHLRKILTRTALPIEHDPLSASERAVWVCGVDLPGQGAPTGTSAATWTARAGRGPAARRRELLRLHDVRADSLQISDRETAARPVCTRHDSTVWRDANGGPAAARAREVTEPEHAGQDRPRRRDQARRRR